MSATDSPLAGGAVDFAAPQAVSRDGDPAGMGVGSVTQAPDGGVYLATRGYGVLRWRGGHLERRPPGDGPAGMTVFDVAVDADGTIWATTDLGLERFRRAAFMTLGRRDGVPFDVPYEADGDASGAVWVSDQSDELYRLRCGTVREVPDSVTAERARVPRGTMYRILAGTRDGVWIGPRPSGLVHARPSGLVPVGPAAGLPSAKVWTTVQDRYGVQWLSVLPGGLGRLRDGRFTWVRLPGVGAGAHVAFASGDSGRYVVVADFDTPLAYAVLAVALLPELVARPQKLPVRDEAPLPVGPSVEVQ